MTDAADHFRTDHLQSDLALHSARGSVVTLVAQAAKFVAGLSATMVLARLLRPEDFGLAAMALATVGILARIKDAGLFTATVQSRHIAQEQATTLFWLSAALAALAAMLTLGLAPVVGWFYRDARLVPITAALALVPLLDGLTVQLQAVMTRQMRFVTLSVMDAGALAAGVAAAIVLAQAGAGYWAIVGQEVVYSAAYAAAIWTVCPWRPGRPRQRSDVRPMVAFGLHLSGSRIVAFLTMNLDTVFVGRFWGPLQAGIYDRAFRLLTIPLALFNQPLTGVAVPALSRLQGDAERYRVFYRAWIRLMFGMSMPLVTFLFVDTERAVVTILGAQWIDIVPMYRVLAPAAFIGRLSMVTSWIYLSTGRADRQLRWSLFLLVPMVAAYIVGVRWGAFGVAVAHTLVTCTLWYPGVAYCCRSAPVRPRDVYGAMALPAVASIAAGLGLLAARSVLPVGNNVAVVFVLDLLVYAALYIGAWVTIPGGKQDLAQCVWLAREAVAKKPGP
jgi:PST family polysaccharide transporter